MLEISQSARRTGLRCIAGAALAVVSLAAVAPSYAADTYPSRPIRLIVGYPPGGSNDIIARIIAPPLGQALGTTVVVENRAGASGVIGANDVVNADPDGYTLLASSVSPIIITPQTIEKAPFNTPRDLKAINMVGLTPEVVAIGPNLKVTTLKELLDLSKKQKITLSSSGTGSLPHLTIELLKQASGGDIIHVPYKGAAPAASDTLAGHVDGIVMDLTPLYSLIQNGKLHALAVTSAKRVSFLPDLPTAQEELPKFNVFNWLGLFAPAKTPQAVVDKINAALQKVVVDPNVKKLLANVATEPSIMTSPAAFQKFVDGEYTRWGKVVKEANIHSTD